MSYTPDPKEDPAISGVPEETPDAASGEGEIDAAAIDQILQDAEGGIEGSTLDAPDD